MKTQTQLEREIQGAKNRLTELEAEQAKRERLERQLTPAQNLAALLHETFCPHNHTDGCGWYYDALTEPATWTYEYGPERRYLEKAEAVLAVTDLNMAVKIIQAVGRN